MTTSADELSASLAELWPKPWPHDRSPSELVAFVGRALDQHRIFPSADRAARRVPQISVFVAHCAPRRAPRRALELAAEFLFAFFALNDEWDDMQALFDGGPTACAGVAFVRSWLERIQRDHGARSARFLAAFDVYLDSLAREKRYESEPHHPTFEEYVDREHGRYQWVATAPYLELWELALAIELAASERSMADELKTLAVELSYLANDIGSLARDSAAKNFVTLLATQEPSLAELPRALAATSRIYADKARSLVALRARLTPGRELARYAALVCDVADGNLRATALLASSGATGRYSPAARDTLNQLPLVSEG